MASSSNEISSSLMDSAAGSYPTQPSQLQQPAGRPLNTAVSNNADSVSFSAPSLQPPPPPPPFRAANSTHLTQQDIQALLSLHHSASANSTSPNNVSPAQMTVLCDLCERLLDEMTLLTDRFEEEKNKNSRLQEELQENKRANQQLWAKVQQLENHLLDREMHSTSTRARTTGYPTSSSPIPATLHGGDPTYPHYTSSAMDEDKKKLIAEMQVVHQKEVEELKAQLAIVKSIQMNRRMLQPFLNPYHQHLPQQQVPAYVTASPYCQHQHGHPSTTSTPKGRKKKGSTTPGGSSGRSSHTAAGTTTTTRTAASNTSHPPSASSSRSRSRSQPQQQQHRQCMACVDEPYATLLVAAGGSSSNSGGHLPEGNHRHGVYPYPTRVSSVSRGVAESTYYAASSSSSLRHPQDAGVVPPQQRSPPQPHRSSSSRPPSGKP